MSGFLESTPNVGYADVAKVPLRRGSVEFDEAIRLGEGKRAQEKGAKDAEHGGIARNSQSEHTDHQQAERGLYPELAGSRLSGC